MKENKRLEKLKSALVKDFKSLYVVEFTTDWYSQRIIRTVEINVMSLENTFTYLAKRDLKTAQIVRKETLELINDYDISRTDPQYIMLPRIPFIAELKQGEIPR